MHEVFQNIEQFTLTNIIKQIHREVSEDKSVKLKPNCGGMYIDIY